VPPTPTPIPPPSAPALTSPPDGQVFAEGEPIALAWTSAGSGVDYVGAISGGPAGTGSFGVDGATTKALGPLAAGYTYTWQVKARGAGGDSSWSAPRTFKVRLAPPTNLQAAVTSCTSARLTWQDQSGSEEGYRISQGTTAIGTTGADATVFDVGDLSDGTTLSFTVRTFRGNQESAASGPVAVKLPVCDTAPPVATWQEPADGATLQHQVVRLDAAAADTGSGVERVAFRGQWSGAWHDIAAFDAGPRYRIDWDLCAAGVPNGPVALEARVLDRAGNAATAVVTATKHVTCASGAVSSLTLSPPSGARGEPVAIAASGFAPGERVSISWDQGSPPTQHAPKHKKGKGKHKKGKGKHKHRRHRSQRDRRGPQTIAVGSTQASADGTAALTFTVPSQASLGSHRVAASGSEGNQAAFTFVVTSEPARAAGERAAPPAAPSSSDDSGGPGAAAPNAVLPAPAERPERTPAKDQDRGRGPGKDPSQRHDRAAHARAHHAKPHKGKTHHAKPHRHAAAKRQR
jgi:hypothetical protein